jgi:uncharacterized protein YndB with AHSA1/START domain
LISSSSNEPIVDTSTLLGTVVVDVTLSASVTETWQALTEPTMVARWFGTLTETLAEGRSVCLDFGDGDFFDLEVIQLDPPHLLQYTWRFLGIGPLDTITWRIIPKDNGCLVTVIDSEPERSPESVLLLKEGWLDFTQRLKRFLTTGMPSRYDWRREFDGSIELASKLEDAWDVLFAPATQSEWLPFGGSVLQAGAHVTITDDAEPSLLQMTDVAWDAPTRVLFHLTHSDWLRPTRCQLELSPHGQGTLLTVSHTGWESISRDSSSQLQQRKRFSALWIPALQRACQLIE